MHQFLKLPHLLEAGLTTPIIKQLFYLEAHAQCYNQIETFKIYLRNKEAHLNVSQENLPTKYPSKFNVKYTIACFIVSFTTCYP